MGWRDRLKVAALTSASGVRVEFDYDDVSRAVEKYAQAFDSPAPGGTYVQDLGHAGRRFPLVAIFHGDDCDLAADLFEAVLLEPGPCQLEHPLYGDALVVPVGAVTRSDALKTAANQSTVAVELWQTVPDAYPTEASDPASDAAVAQAAFAEAAAAQFDAALVLDTSAELVGLRSAYEQGLRYTRSALSAVAGVQDAARTRFDAVYAAASSTVDTLVADPLALGFQAVLLLNAPAQAAGLLSARLSAYNDLATALLNGEGAEVRPSYDASTANSIATTDLYLLSAVAGAAAVVADAELTSRPEGADAAAKLLALFSAAVTWREAALPAAGLADTGEAYAALLAVVSATCKAALVASYALPAERAIVTGKARTIIDLAAELYGAVDDDTLDKLITANGFEGSELLEVPAGRRVVYYA